MVESTLAILLALTSAAGSNLITFDPNSHTIAQAYAATPGETAADKAAYLRQVADTTGLFSATLEGNVVRSSVELACKIQTASRIIGDDHHFAHSMLIPLDEGVTLSEKNDFRTVSLNLYGDIYLHFSNIESSERSFLTNAEDACMHRQEALETDPQQHNITHFVLPQINIQEKKEALLGFSVHLNNDDEGPITLKHSTHNKIQVGLADSSPTTNACNLEKSANIGTFTGPVFVWATFGNKINSPIIFATRASDDMLTAPGFKRESQRRTFQLDTISGGAALLTAAVTHQTLGKIPQKKESGTQLTITQRVQRWAHKLKKHPYMTPVLAGGAGAIAANYLRNKARSGGRHVNFRSDESSVSAATSSSSGNK